MIKTIKDFLRLEAASGVVLMLAAALAMIIANSQFASDYETLLAWKIGASLDGRYVGMSLSHWINDGLMAIFFLLVGLEIKREFLEGELSTMRQATLPVVAALGGVITPAAIYVWFNWGGDAVRGWAIPSATDIAFSLGVLALFGDRVNHSLKIFLMAVAVIDDLIAVLIIAIFYTGELSLPALALAGLCVLFIFLCNRSGYRKGWIYVIAGIILWAATLKSGVHATVAGVMLGCLIPLKGTRDKEGLCKTMIHALHPWVAFGIVPLFAFANAGVSLSGIGIEQLMHPVPLGIALGLFVGKQLGIFGVCWLMIKVRLARLPTGAGWSELYAVCVLAGIGFTMSLFIGALAFNNSQLQDYIRIGVIIGSLLSAVFGYIAMSFILRKKES